MIEDLTADSFSGHEGSTFTVHVGNDEKIELELEGVDEHEYPDQESFSVLFRGATDNGFPHGTYRVEHDEIGECEVSLGPVVTGKEKDDDVQHFEAVFTRRE